MERLPYIDEHVISVAADRADTWAGLMQMWCRDTPFFSRDEVTPRHRLALTGRHWFAVYKLVFELGDDGPGHTRVSACTWADFPGVHGSLYRALVIGSGGHRIAVRRMLRRIASDARAVGAAA